MGIIDSFNNPGKFKGVEKKKSPLKTDFSNGEDSDAWFVSWVLYGASYPDRSNRIIREFGSEIFIFSKKTPPKDILLLIKDSLCLHLNGESGLSLKKIHDSNKTLDPTDTNDALLIDLKETLTQQAHANIHILQLNKL